MFEPCKNLKYIIKCTLPWNAYLVMPVPPVPAKPPGYDHHLHVSNKHTHLIRPTFLSIFHCMKVYRDW